MRIPVGDGVVLATDSADANAAERENAGFDRRPADYLDDLCHIQTGIEIGGVLNREMRHVRTSQTILRRASSLAALEKHSLRISFGHHRKGHCCTFTYAHKQCAIAVVSCTDMP
jgi:hypothetical protein